MSVRRRTVLRAAASAAAVVVLAGIGFAANVASAIPLPGPSGSAGTGPVGPVLANPDAVLPAGWHQSSDRALTTVGDADALDVLVADESDGYRWRTAASLSEPGFDTDQWIGTACLTGSGTRAVVVYAPRQFTNSTRARDAGGFVAVVDLTSGTVRKLPVRASLAYFDPGCGAGEDIALSRLSQDGTTTTTVVDLVDASTGNVRSEFTTTGQVTSAVPYGSGVAAVRGSHIVSLAPGRALQTLTDESGTPFRLHPDRSGGLAYQVPAGRRVTVRRLAAGTSTTLGGGALGAVQVIGSAGQVYLIGPDAGKIRPAAGWRALAAPVNAEVSTTGALAVVSSSNHPAGQARSATVVAPGGRPTSTVAIRAQVTVTGKAVSFALEPAAQRPADGLSASPALDAVGTAAPGTRSGSAGRSAITPQAVDPSTVPWDPDRACAVPRNDPTIQTYQATASQVEWAVDLAVIGKLTINRAVNWKNSGVPISWTPQSMFPLHKLVGHEGDHVPAQVMLGVLAQESNTMQASPHAVDGLTGNVNQGGFYGNGVNWSTADCGYGVGQVTSGMAMNDASDMYTPNQQKAIDTDYASNIAASVDALVDKWNALRAANIVAGDGSPVYIENWYLAAWAYNTGIQPDAARGNTTGCTPGPACTDGAGNWGLGWSNNPANPAYPVDRENFTANSDFDTKHPNLWPYQEKVIGWAFTPVARFDYQNGDWQPAYAAADGSPQLPDRETTFCNANINHCEPGAAGDVNNNPGAGLCTLADLHCWWHKPVSWVTCTPATGQTTNCGLERRTYSAGSAEPSGPVVYPADCSTSGLGNAIIVDDVTTPSALPCNKTWTNQGSFSFKFTSVTPSGCTSDCITYPGKMDLHQLGTGFGGHLWFTHTQTRKTLTGTWKPPSSVTGWTRIKVHIPQNGATTEQADYTINLGNGQTRHRVVNQHWEQNTWVDLGTFALSAGASVSLSNASSHVAAARVDGGDLAFDAVAFIPSGKPTVRYVALGDSYSSGESVTPFTADSEIGTDACHRSATGAYSHMVKVPGHTKSIADEAAAGTADFHFLACSGAQSVDVTQAAVQPGNTDNTSWRTVNEYHYGEVNQIDDSGWVDQDTTLVTVSMGGNDVGFGDVAQGCLNPLCLSSSYRLKRAFGDKPNQTTRKDPQALTTYEPYLIGQLRSHLAALYEKVHQAAPNARVIVLGYPHLFTVVSSKSCTGFTYLVQQWMDNMADKMTATISGAVSDAKAAYPTMSITFVDSTKGFAGHAVCDSSPWINGIVAPPDVAFSLHPNGDGQKEYAALVNATM